MNLSQRIEDVDINERKKWTLKKTELIIFLAAGLLLSVIYIILRNDNYYLIIVGRTGYWAILHDNPFLIKSLVYAFLPSVITTVAGITVLFLLRFILYLRVRRISAWAADTLTYGGGFIFAFFGGVGMHRALALVLGAPLSAYSAHTLVAHLDSMAHDVVIAQLLFAATVAWAVAFLIWAGEWLFRLIKTKRDIQK